MEIHRKSSDWYLHNHGDDSNYQNIILHVVWEDDLTVFRKDNTAIPTLELKNFIPQKLLANYQKLFDGQGISFINCEREIAGIDQFLISQWLERLYIERVEKLSVRIHQLLTAMQQDWEQVFFMLLLKSFGSKINGEAFMSIGKALDFKVVRKLAGKQFQLESILFGMSGLLEDTGQKDAYCRLLRSEYRYLKNKFRLDGTGVFKSEFFKLRPVNFPTIRLSQLATLYATHPQLFSQVIGINTVKGFYELFEVAASPYWRDHYTFGKRSGPGPRKLSPEFIDLLLINTVLPIKFCYAACHGTVGTPDIIGVIRALKSENNGIIDKYESLNLRSRDAGESQALLHLYHEYCTRNKCLHCAIGSALLSGK